MTLLIKGGRIIDPANQIDMTGDVLIEDGRIKEVSPSIASNGAEFVNAEGMIVCPGFIDMHVHLREPGLEYKETIASGVRAAAVGGFTTICCMPNTDPVCDNRAVASFIVDTARRQGLVNVYPIGCITKGQKGQEITEMAALVDAGCVGISDDGKPVMNAEVMRRAMEYAKMFKLPVISHCEDMYLSEGGQMHEGYYSTLYGLKGIPSVAEEAMVARDIMLSGMTGSKLHIAHISTKGSLELIREAKKAGLSVSCEVTPHHLTLTDQDLGTYDADYKVNPPLRSQEHVDALIAGLSDGTIDCLATDHAPHEIEVKDCEFNLASFGISGLETAVAVIFSYLIDSGQLDLNNVVKAFTVMPARILGLDRGTLTPGKVADITIIDPNATQQVDPQRFQSKGKNTPYKGRVLKGWPYATLVGGKVIAQKGNIIQ
ncbi:MAG: dihydroorotase [Syntrophomonadales bacterium]|jgi:dihydroorotase